MFDSSSLVNIFLTSYASFITLVVLSLVIYIWRLRKRSIFKKCSEDGHKIENLQKLQRKSVDNKYELDSLHEQNEALLRSQSASIRPNRARLVSEYDGIACASKSHESEDSKKYEQIEAHHYETILEKVAITLNAIHSDSSKENDVYERFFIELLKRVKDKCPELYQTIQNSRTVNEHQYEEIPEHTQSTNDKNNDFSYEDDDYATFHCPKIKMLASGAKFPGNLKDKVSLGSDDHLKYLKESKSRENINKDTPYLEAKRFSATSDCPPKLRRLCQNQKSKIDNQRVNVPISGNNKQFDMSEYNVSSPMSSRVTSSNDNQNRSRVSRPPNVSIRILSQQAEKVLKPAVPPKRFRVLSRSEDDVL